jgi:prephenate dehydratase
MRKHGKLRLKIGIQGGIGSFNEQAALHYLNKSSIDSYEINHLFTTKKVLKHLNDGSIDLGLFAIHNSIGGMVSESIEAMGMYNFEVAQEFAIPIRHFLMRLSDSKTDEIRRIMAHPQVFAQCRSSLDEKYPNLMKESGEGDLIDTAQAAKALATKEIPNHTAILGPERLAELYGFEIIDRDLQDDRTNDTSFLLVSKIR